MIDLLICTYEPFWQKSTILSWPLSPVGLLLLTFCLFIKISIIVNILNFIGLIKFYFFNRVSASTQHSTWSLEIALPHDPLLDRLIDRWCVQRVSVLRVCYPFEIYRWYINIYHIEIFNVSFIHRYHWLLLLYYVIIQLEQHFDACVLVSNPNFPNPILHRWSSNFTKLWCIFHSSRTSQNDEHTSVTILTYVTF